MSLHVIRSEVHPNCRRMMYADGLSKEDCEAVLHALRLWVKLRRVEARERGLPYSSHKTFRALLQLMEEVDARYAMLGALPEALMAACVSEMMEASLGDAAARRCSEEMLLVVGVEPEDASDILGMLARFTASRRIGAAIDAMAADGPPAGVEQIVRELVSLSEAAARKRSARQGGKRLESKGKRAPWGAALADLRVGLALQSEVRGADWVDVFRERRQGAEAIWASSASGDVEGLRRGLAAAGACRIPPQIDALQAPEGRTALHLAALGGSLPCIKILLDAGADQHAQTRQGAAPLDLAAQEGHEEATRFLLGHKAKARPKDPPGARTVSPEARSEASEDAGLFSPTSPLSPRCFADTPRGMSPEAHYGGELRRRNSRPRRKSTPRFGEPPGAQSESPKLVTASPPPETRPASTQLAELPGSAAQTERAKTATPDKPGTPATAYHRDLFGGDSFISCNPATPAMLAGPADAAGAAKLADQAEHPEPVPSRRPRLKTATHLVAAPKDWCETFLAAHQALQESGAFTPLGNNFRRDNRVSLSQSMRLETSCLSPRASLRVPSLLEVLSKTPVTRATSSLLAFPGRPGGVSQREQAAWPDASACSPPSRSLRAPAALGSSFHGVPPSAAGCGYATAGCEGSPWPQLPGRAGARMWTVTSSSLVEKAGRSLRRRSPRRAARAASPARGRARFPGLTARATIGDASWPSGIADPRERRGEGRSPRADHV